MNCQFSNSVRIAHENWESAERLEELLGLLEKYNCAVSELALFTASVHTPLKPAELKRRAEIIKVRMKRIREAGFKAGINILATIGHHNEDLDNTVLGMGYHNMTDANGNICLGSFCMNDDKYIEEYVIPTYITLAEAKPEFIWVDDDIRYNHMGIESGCFCDVCIEKYNKSRGTDYTREEIKNKLYSDDREFRLDWLCYSTERISNILRIIGDTVRGVDKSIMLGFMTGERFIEGNDFKAFSEALSSDGKYEIMWRPGGGAYDDFNFESGIMEKADEVGRQNAYLPPYVTVIQSEIENFPYQLIKKSPKSTAAEALLHMQSGCTGAAFNILPSESGEPVSGIEKHLKKIDAYVPVYKAFGDAVSGMEITGIHNSWHIKTQAITPEGQWFRDESCKYVTYNREMYMSGLPQSFNIKNAEAVVLNADNAQLYSDEELLDFFRGGMYMDGEAVKYLTKRGFGKYIGFSIGKELEVDCTEKYTDTPINDGFSGFVRNCHQAFHPGTAYELIPMGKHINLASVIDYHQNVLIECSMGIFENALGGRVCVGGYFPYEWVSDIGKATQLKRVFRYITNDGISAYADTYCRVRVINYTKEGTVLSSIFNSTNDEIEDLEIAIRTDSEECEFCNGAGEKKIIGSVRTDGKYKFFEIKKLDAFDFCYLKTK